MNDSARDLPVEDARKLISDHCASAVAKGHTDVKFRVPTDVPEVWLYQLEHHDWHKVGAVPCEPDLKAAVLNQFSMLAGKPHRTELQVRQHAKHDFSDTEFRFSKDGVAGREPADLHSYLYGLLFYDHRDTQHDRRQSIRKGPERI